MRVTIYAVLGLALAALDPSRTQSIVASGAAIVLECLPYLCASDLAARLCGGRARRWLAYAGCGCGGGPAARSIPAALATAWLFGPLVAAGRLAAAMLIAPRSASCCDRAGTLSDELLMLLPAAALAAAAATIAPALHVATQSPLVQAIAGAAFGALASPCALGGVALAASLRASSPIAAYAVLCTAGLIDIRRILPHAGERSHDGFAYALLALACAIAWFEHGGTFVNPRLCPALLACVPICAIAAYRARASRDVAARYVAAALLAAVVLGAPAPAYIATETTLDGAYSGEIVDFTGAYLRNGQSAIVERYAITCCRADAAPVALALAAPLRMRYGSWVRVRGEIARVEDRIVLRVRRYEEVPPPHDPFVYR